MAFFSGVVDVAAVAPLALVDCRECVVEEVLIAFRTAESIDGVILEGAEMMEIRSATLGDEAVSLLRR